MPGNSQLSSHRAITIDVNENKPLKQENVGHNGAMWRSAQQYVSTSRQL
jgi:hypothetical protein